MIHSKKKLTTYLNEVVPVQSIATTSVFLEFQSSLDTEKKFTVLFLSKKQKIVQYKPHSTNFSVACPDLGTSSCLYCDNHYTGSYKWSLADRRRDKEIEEI